MRYSLKETLWFICITLALGWLVGGLWLLDERRHVLLRVMMCLPAVVALGCAWVFQSLAGGVDFSKLSAQPQGPARHPPEGLRAGRAAAVTGSVTGEVLRQG